MEASQIIHFGVPPFLQTPQYNIEIEYHIYIEREIDIDTYFYINIHISVCVSTWLTPRLPPSKLQKSPQRQQVGKIPIKNGGRVRSKTHRLLRADFGWFFWALNHPLQTLCLVLKYPSLFLCSLSRLPLNLPRFSIYMDKKSNLAMRCLLFFHIMDGHRPVWNDEAQCLSVFSQLQPSI